MLTQLSIKSLYTYALAEEEGVGTAYEYFAKRLVLRPWLKAIPKPKTVLIAGLPQQYGCSLDFLLLTNELGVQPTIVDERPENIAKLQRVLKAAQAEGVLTNLNPTAIVVGDLTELETVSSTFDLAICSEVLQRISAEKRPAFIQTLRQKATHTAIFCPNQHNKAHVGISGLDGLTLTDLRQLAPNAVRSGYIDMPPFPPGITRSDDQREQATSGRFEAFAMWGLQSYARAEKLIPTPIRRSQSHIVYCLMND